MDLYRRQLLQLLGVSGIPDLGVGEVGISLSDRSNARTPDRAALHNWQAHTLSADANGDYGHQSLERLELLDVGFEATGNPAVSARESIFGERTGCYRYTFAVTGSAISHVSKDKTHFWEIGEAMGDHFEPRKLNLDARIGSRVSVEADNDSDMESMALAPRHGHDSFQVYTTPSGDELGEDLAGQYPDADIENLGEYISLALGMSHEQFQGDKSRVGAYLPNQSKLFNLSPEEIYQAIRNADDLNDDLRAGVEGTLAVASLSLAALALFANPPAALGAGVIVASIFASELLSDNYRPRTKYAKGFDMTYPSREGGPVTHHNLIFDVYVEPDQEVSFNVTTKNFGTGIGIDRAHEANPGIGIGEWTIDIAAPGTNRTHIPVPSFEYNFSQNRSRATRELNAPQIEFLTEPFIQHTLIRGKYDGKDQLEPRYLPVPGYLLPLPVYIGQAPGSESTGEPPIEFSAKNSLLTDSNRETDFTWHHSQFNSSHFVGIVNDFDEIRQQIRWYPTGMQAEDVYTEPDFYNKQSWRGKSSTGTEFSVTPQYEGLHVVGLEMEDPTGNRSTVSRPYLYLQDEGRRARNHAGDFEIEQVGSRTFRFNTNNSLPDMALLGSEPASRNEVVRNHLREPLTWFWERTDAESTDFAFKRFGSGEQVSYTFGQAGTYEIHHVVTDSQHISYVATETIEVN
ncbi:hypothetical protein [Haloarchaeobius iranensis]|uniref:PKD domain-containing protein n=1 Tax=Haloarchaeobius iranensis TaxID=996166 RepID=A0A1H0C1Z4_9EURY|nr:hypothetical protein [Haloarchaeobius iranensis]SDN51891.1 hypothetical protein SAMN05192554_1542 [Haloarchaeobius iranensis]